jgi:calcineurin-like phosphoesterase family protein
MNLYISDTHFGHKNVIRFDHRPFADIEEMDRSMIYLWNSRVQKDDDVYIVGDFCYKPSRTPDWYLRQLKGHKHLITGNHDRVTLECPGAMKYLEHLGPVSYVEDGERGIVLCHYPMAEWYNSRHGSTLVYGHIHNNTETTYDFMKTLPNAFNAGACINNYTPASMNELIRNNRIFQGQTKQQKETTQEMNGPENKRPMHRTYKEYTAEEAEGLQIKQLMESGPNTPVLLRHKTRILRGYVLSVDEARQSCSFQAMGGPVVELPVRELWGIQKLS